ncbi:MAG TPA: twin-arginine translocase TatA/TatE family subunit [Coriobacteriia bacterium]
MNLDKTLIIILIIALVVVGPTQIPKLAKMFGKSAKALKDGIDGKLDEEEDEKPVAKAKKDDEEEV